MTLRYALHFLRGTARKAWLAWRGGRLSLSPAQWVVHLRNYYSETAPLPFAGVSTAAVPPLYVAPLPQAPPQLLVITDYVPRPDRDSGSVRLSAMLDLLIDQGFALTLISHAHMTDRRYVDALEQRGINVMQGPKAAIDHLTSYGYRYRFVLLSRPQSAYRYLFPVRLFVCHATVVYDTVDLHWVRLQREADVTGDAESRARAGELRSIEQFNVESADEVIAISETEREVLLAMRPSARVHVLSNIHRISGTTPEWHGRRNLLFIGSFLHPPNADAVRYFVADVFPLVRRELPDVEFTILGDALTGELEGLESAAVHPIGYVPNADPYFAEARVFVCPLRYGAGMKGKIGHSMSLGLPVVTTAIGAEGMALVDRETALIADEPAVFASAVVRLYRDEQLWTALAQQAKAHVETHFSEAVARERLRTIFPTANERAERDASEVDARRA